MELKLSKPICLFDLETTGIDITKDRIVEISILKVYPNGNKESKTWLVNPTIPIPIILFLFPFFFYNFSKIFINFHFSLSVALNKYDIS